MTPSLCGWCLTSRYNRTAYFFEVSDCLFGRLTARLIVLILPLPKELQSAMCNLKQHHNEQFSLNILAILIDDIGNLTRLASYKDKTLS